MWTESKQISGIWSSCHLEWTKACAEHWRRLFQVRERLSVNHFFGVFFSPFTQWHAFFFLLVSILLGQAQQQQNDVHENRQNVFLSLHSSLITMPLTPPLHKVGDHRSYTDHLGIYSPKNQTNEQTQHSTSNYSCWATSCPWFRSILFKSYWQKRWEADLPWCIFCSQTLQTQLYLI